MKRIKELAEFLGVKQSEITEGYDEVNFETNEGDYLVLTDSEADEMTAEYIRETLWAFNPWFLSNETGIDEEVFKAIAENGNCEGNNEAIERLIGDLDSFIESAISEDGRGHFMSSYDGEENSVGEYYIYRTN